jgi:hypothetical protein
MQCQGCKAKTSRKCSTCWLIDDLDNRNPATRTKHHLYSDSANHIHCIVCNAAISVLCYQCQQERQPRTQGQQEQGTPSSVPSPTEIGTPDQPPKRQRTQEIDKPDHNNNFDHKRLTTWLHSNENRNTEATQSQQQSSSSPSQPSTVFASNIMKYKWH